MLSLGILINSGVNKDLGPKVRSKDRRHKAKAKDLAKVSSKKRKPKLTMITK